MTSMQGEISEHREVSGVLVVQGALSAGATVRDGGRLQVDGHIQGPLHVERGGEVVVRGSLAGDIHNRGIVFAAGLISAKLRENDGVFAVAPGTLFDDAPRQRVLQHDGTLSPLPNDGGKVSLDVDASRFLRLDESGKFVPL